MPDPTSKSSRPNIPVNMHPTRMLQIANSIAAKPDANDDVRALAAMVASLCFHVDRVTNTANRASTLTRRMGL